MNTDIKKKIRVAPPLHLPLRAVQGSVYQIAWSACPELRLIYRSHASPASPTFRPRASSHSRSGPGRCRGLL